MSRFELGGGASFLSEAQEAQLKAWIVETLPRTTRVIGAFIRREFGVEYESRSGLIKLSDFLCCAMAIIITGRPGP